MPPGQKNNNKKTHKSNIVTNSIKTFKNWSTAKKILKKKKQILKIAFKHKDVLASITS